MKGIIYQLRELFSAEEGLGGSSPYAGALVEGSHVTVGTRGRHTTQDQFENVLFVAFACGESQHTSASLLLFQL